MEKTMHILNKMTRRSAVKNMMAATVVLTGGTGVAAAAEVDPIIAAIETHKAASARHVAAVARYSEFERQLQAVNRLQKAGRHEDELARGAEIEAAMDAAHDEQTYAACALCDIRPTTEAGLMAQLSYAITADTDGEMWPRELDIVVAILALASVGVFALHILD